MAISLPETFAPATDTLTPRQIVIDEIQKVPFLLDEVHWLIENKKMAFALCGSSDIRRLVLGYVLGGRLGGLGPRVSGHRVAIGGLHRRVAVPGFDRGGVVRILIGGVRAALVTSVGISQA